MSTALRTDRYELTMLRAALASGAARQRCVFRVFARSVPEGRGFGVVGGVARLLDQLNDFTFDADDLAWLVDSEAIDEPTADYLRNWSFGGDIFALLDGELWAPGAPVMTVVGTFAETVLLETIVLSTLNHDSAIAAAASRMLRAADGHAVIDMGSRRTDPDAAIAVAHIACALGFAGTSNLEAGKRYGLPTMGTAAHAFILAHSDERQAFAAQLDALGPTTTLLVDTFDIAQGIRNAVEGCNERGFSGPGAIRIDSGDRLHESRSARILLDSLEAFDTRIVLSGDLDEFAIEQLENAAGGRAPVDVYGIGTHLVTGSGSPTAGFVYKLVGVGPPNARVDQLRPVDKLSSGKSWSPGFGEVASEFVIGVDDAQTRPPKVGQVLVVEGLRTRLRTLEEPEGDTFADIDRGSVETRNFRQQLVVHKGLRVLRESLGSVSERHAARLASIGAGAHVSNEPSVTLVDTDAAMPT